MLLQSSRSEACLWVARGCYLKEPTMAAVQEREMERVGASVSLNGRRGAPVTELTPLER